MIENVAFKVNATKIFLESCVHYFVQRSHLHTLVLHYIHDGKYSILHLTSCMFSFQHLCPSNYFKGSPPPTTLTTIHNRLNTLFPFCFIPFSMCVQFTTPCSRDKFIHEHLRIAHHVGRYPMRGQLRRHGVVEVLDVAYVQSSVCVCGLT